MTEHEFDRGALRPTDDLTGFACGVDELDAWLRNHARHARRAGTAHTVVWTVSRTSRVVAYYAIAPAAIVAADVPPGLRAGTGPQPAYHLAKLALDTSLHGMGLGGDLLMDAVAHIVRQADSSAGRFILVDPINAASAAFYLHHGFRATGDTTRLVRKVSSARDALKRASELD